MSRRSLIVLFVLLSLVLSACATPQAAPAEKPADASQPAATTADNSGKACSEVEPAAKDGKFDLGGCTLRIAVENAYKPFNFIDTTTNKPVGYDYDIFAEICARSNCQTEFVESSWDAMVAVMGGQGEADTFDVAADGITITEERAQHVDFSTPYIRSEQMLMVRADESRFSEPADFVTDASLKVGTQIGTTNYDAAKELLGGEDRIVAFDQFGPAVQALLAGDIDAVMIDNVSGLGYVGTSGDKLKLTGKPIKVEELGFMFPKGSKLKQVIDGNLAAMKSDGKLDTLYNQWFKQE